MESSFKLKKWFYDNMANFITVARLLFASWLIFLGVWQPGQIILIFILVLLSALSDLLDGWLARRNEITSEIGGLLDRLSDKAFICPTIFIIIWRYWPVDDIGMFSKLITEGIVAVVIFFEVLLILSGIWGFFHGFTVTSNQFGKKKMVFESIAVISFFLFLCINRYNDINMLIPVVVVDTCLVAAIYFAVKSADGYYNGLASQYNQKYSLKK